MQRRGFSLIELLVVIAILALLAALLFPVYFRAKNASKQSKCLSNLKQIGGAFMLYMQDYDDIWPFGVDPADKYTPDIWSDYPEFKAKIPSIPLMHELLQPYLPSKAVWECPADKGQIIDDVSFHILESMPSSYEKFGTSYYYRTELTVKSLISSSIPNLPEINVYFDGSGAWHTGEPLLERNDSWEEIQQKLKNYRYNVLWGDFHAKNVTREQYWTAWQTPLL